MTIEHRSILVSGGSGSFGKAFIRRLLETDGADRICVYSRGEHAQEAAARELAPLDPHGKLRFFVGCVRDRARLEMAMRGIDIVVHAAAMKVVPKCEFDPFEAIKTNILGAQNVIEAALAQGVQKVIALSTDKCVSPANLYGATKLCAEKLFTAANVYAGDQNTKFAVVRYGNIAGSQGSVIPLWQKLIASGQAHVPVTSPFCTRYYMTLDDAVDLVQWTSDNMVGGEIVIPEMPAYLLGDLVTAMGAKAHVLGMRPGEKLHEAIINEHEMHLFARSGDYWVAGSNPKRHGAVTLDGPLSSDTARRMSVAELRGHLANLGFVRLDEVA